MKYRKKPVVIEAIQFLDDDARVSELIEFTDGKFMAFGDAEHYSFAKINTLEGKIKVSVGDYIIKGVNGELYPCEEEVFLKNYESVS